MIPVTANGFVRSSSSSGSYQSFQVIAMTWPRTIDDSAMRRNWEVGYNIQVPGTPPGLVEGSPQPGAEALKSRLERLHRFLGTSFLEDAAQDPPRLPPAVEPPDPPPRNRLPWYLCHVFDVVKEEAARHRPQAQAAQAGPSRPMPGSKMAAVRQGLVGLDIDEALSPSEYSLRGGDYQVPLRATAPTE